MASEAQLNTLQQLYIAYFGRPAEPAGVTYWEGRIDAGMTLDEVANSFTSADEFVAKYGDDTAALVRAAYQNALGREVESEAALAFWVEQLESGDVTPADLMNSFFGTSDATDLAVLNNRTEVAKAYTAAAGENYDAAASAALLTSVDDTQASVDAALEQVPGVPGEAFTLTEALAIIAEGGELPEGYELADATADLGALAIADVAAAQQVAADIVAGAANAEELTLETTYSINDTLANVADEANAEVVDGATGYSLTDTTLVLGAGTITSISEQIAAAQAVVDGAANAEELEFTPEYTIKDSAENVLAAAGEENPLVADISLISLTDETITAVQRDALVELGFVAEDLPALDSASTLTNGLEALQAAKAELAAKLAEIAVADNGNTYVDGDAEITDADLLEGFVGAYTAQNASDEKVAATQAIENAQAVIDTKSADLSFARAEKIVGLGNDGQLVVDSLTNFTANTVATDANLAKAVADAQALVNADKALYTEAGVKIAVDATTAADGYVKLYANAAGTVVQAEQAEGLTFAGFGVEQQDTFGTVSSVTPAQTFNGSAEKSQEVKWAHDFSSGTLAADDTVTVVVNGVSFTSTYDGSEWSAFASGSASLQAAVQVTGTEVVVSYTDDSPFVPGGLSTNIADGSAEEAANVAATLLQPYAAAEASTFVFEIAAGLDGQVTIDGVEYEVTDGTLQTAGVQAAAGVASVVQNGASVTVTGLIVNGVPTDISAIPVTSAPLVEAAYVADDIIPAADMFSAAKLQALAEVAVANLETDIANNGDNAALLAGLRTAINAYLAAEGNAAADVDGNDGSETVTTVRDRIVELLDDEELDEGQIDLLVEAIAGYSLPLADQTAPVVATAAEAAVNAAIKAIETRVELQNAEDATATAFETTTSGAVLEAAENLQSGRAEEVKAVETAQADKVAAEEYAAIINALVAEHGSIAEEVAGIEQQIKDLGIDSLVNLSGDTGGTLFGSDLFVFSTGEKDLQITRFEADDLLFLGNYSRVDLGATDNLATQRLGDANVLEVFFKQNAGNVDLYVETEAFAGNAIGGLTSENTLDGFVKITVTGATVANLVLEEGFVSLV